MEIRIVPWEPLFSFNRRVHAPLLALRRPKNEWSGSEGKPIEGLRHKLGAMAVALTETSGISTYTRFVQRYEARHKYFHPCAELYTADQVLARLVVVGALGIVPSLAIVTLNAIPDATPKFFANFLGISVGFPK